MNVKNGNLTAKTIEAAAQKAMENLGQLDNIYMPQANYNGLKKMITSGSFREMMRRLLKIRESSYAFEQALEATMKNVTYDTFTLGSWRSDGGK